MESFAFMTRTDKGIGQITINLADIQQFGVQFHNINNNILNNLQKR
jgi:hypothetical protein